MNQSKVLILGDSHARALKTAYAITSMLPHGPSFDINWLENPKHSETRRGGVSVNDALSKIEALTAQDILVFSLLGTLHNVYGLLRYDPPFILETSGEVTGDKATCPSMIPENVFFDFFRQQSAREKRIRLLRERARSRVFHIATPPPKGDDDYMRSKITRYRDKHLADVGLNPPRVRLKLWQIEMNALKEVSADMGMAFIESPSAAQSDDGFLKREFYGDDATHANEAYGELVLRQIEKIALGATSGA